MNKVYTGLSEVKEYKDLGQARRAFTYMALRNQRCALVRENGLNFEVTTNTTNEVKTVSLPNSKAINQILTDLF